MASSLDLPLRVAQGSTLFLCRFLTKAWVRYVAWAAYRRSLQDLRELDARLLVDIGLSEVDQRRGHPDP